MYITHIMHDILICEGQEFAVALSTDECDGVLFSQTVNILCDVSGVCRVHGSASCLCTQEAASH